MLALLDRTGRARRPRRRAPEESIDDPVDRDVARRAASEQLRAAAEPGRRAAARARRAHARGHRPERRRRARDGWRQRAGADASARSRRSPGSARASATTVEIEHERGCTSNKITPPLDTPLPRRAAARSRTTRAASAPAIPCSSRTRERGVLHVHRSGRRRRARRLLGAHARGTLVAARVRARGRSSVVQVGRARVLARRRGRSSTTGTRPSAATRSMGMGSAELARHDRARRGRAATTSSSRRYPPAPALGGLSVGLRAAGAAPTCIDRAVAAARARRRGRVRRRHRRPVGDRGQRPRVDDAARRRRTSSSARSRRRTRAPVVVVNAASPVDDAVGRRRRRGPAVLVRGRGVGQRARRRAQRRRVAVGQAADDVPGAASRTRPRSRTIPASDGKVRYGEGVFVGYRWYDARSIEPRFCFGHGLSYTTFEHRRRRRGRTTPATRSGRARGSRDATPARDAAPRSCSATSPTSRRASPRPPQELKAFAKVWLDPGESRDGHARSSTSARSRSGTSSAHDWTVEPGEFELRIGTSSRDIRRASR